MVWLELGRSYTSVRGYLWITSTNYLILIISFHSIIDTLTHDIDINMTIISLFILIILNNSFIKVAKRGKLY